MTTTLSLAIGLFSLLSAAPSLADDRPATSHTSSIQFTIGSHYDGDEIIAVFTVAVSKERPSQITLLGGYDLEFSLGDDNSIDVEVANPHALRPTRLRYHQVTTPMRGNPTVRVEVPVRIQICGKGVTVVPATDTSGCKLRR
jgi:hypothetical protein